VQRALRGWRVDTVVLPDQPELPEYDQVASVPDMAALITGATGLRPTHSANAWVWNGVGRVTPLTAPTAQRFTGCTDGIGTTGRGTVDHVVNCMLVPATA